MLSKVRIHGKWKKYFKEGWNVLDAFGCGLYIIGYVLVLVPHYYTYSIGMYVLKSFYKIRNNRHPLSIRKG